MAGIVIAVAFIVLGFFTTIGQARRGFDLSGDIGRLTPTPEVAPVAGIVSLLFFFLNFAIMVGAGLWYRHRPSIHKRLMLLAMLLGLTPTPIAHLIGHWVTLQQWAAVIVPVSFILLMSLSAIYDRVSEGRIHPVSVWVPLLLFGWQLVFQFVVLPSAMWPQFAEWLIR